MVCESPPTSNNPDLYNDFVTMVYDYNICFSALLILHNVS